MIERNKIKKPKAIQDPRSEINELKIVKVIKLGVRGKEYFR
jgi:5-formaminoimidazole-4-carboxamide-1-beta-D-ribofuranosyl 5'-monophosphate synthetase